MKSERGFALVSVMMLLLAAAVAAGVALIVARADLGAAEAAVRQARLAAAVEGAAALVAADLLDPDAASRAPALDGSKGVVYAVGDVSVAVRVVSEQGRLNLNTAAPDQVAAVVRGLGGEGGTQMHVQRELQRVKEDGGRLRHITEARALFGDDEASFRAVLPFVTVRGDGNLDAAYAPAGFKDLLPELRGESADPDEAPLDISSFPTLALFIEAGTAGGAVMREERIVRVTPRQGLVTLERRPLNAEALAALFGDAA